jgi:hypothetical protein
MSKSKKVDLTVVGYYTDNDQPFVAHIEGPIPDGSPMDVVLAQQEVYKLTRKELQERHDADRGLSDDPHCPPFVVVEAFKGKITGELMNDSVIGAGDVQGS